MYHSNFKLNMLLLSLLIVWLFHNFVEIQFFHLNYIILNVLCASYCSVFYNEGKAIFKLKICRIHLFISLISHLHTEGIHLLPPPLELRLPQLSGTSHANYCIGQFGLFDSRIPGLAWKDGAGNTCTHSTYWGRGEIGEVYMPSQLERTPQLGSWWYIKWKRESVQPAPD
jgi:hypothetical protein